MKNMGLKNFSHFFCCGHDILERHLEMPYSEHFVSMITYNVYKCNMISTNFYLGWLYFTWIQEFYLLQHTTQNMLQICIKWSVVGPL